MEWDPKWLRETMWTGEVLVWGAHIETTTPGDTYWFTRDVYFTTSRVLWWSGSVASEIRYEEISKMAKRGPGSGGFKGVRALNSGGGCVFLGSSRGTIDMQFQDAQSLEYANWLLNEAARGGELKAAEGVPVVEGTRDPSAPPPAPPEKKGGCFVATASFGPEDSSVVLLQRYRDQVLLRSRVGRGVMRAYYAVSPPLARFIEVSDGRRSFARTVLGPLVSFVQRRLR